MKFQTALSNLQDNGVWVWGLSSYSLLFCCVFSWSVVDPGGLLFKHVQCSNFRWDLEKWQVWRRVLNILLSIFLISFNKSQNFVREPEASTSRGKVDTFVSLAILFFPPILIQFMYHNTVQPLPPVVWEHSHHSRKIPGAHLHIILTPTSSFRQPLVCFLSLGICLFWTLHIHRLIHYAVFYVWHNIFAYIGTSFLFINTVNADPFICWLFQLFSVLGSYAKCWHVLYGHVCIPFRFLGWNCWVI